MRKFFKCLFCDKEFKIDFNPLLLEITEDEDKIVKKIYCFYCGNEHIVKNF